MYLFVKVFIFYDAVKPCEIFATKAKYLNQCKIVNSTNFLKIKKF